jgi:MurNAc alpha-1-phosphate uridylyltransferase
LQWHLEALAQAGLHQVTINVAHLGSQIQDFAGDGSRFGVAIRYSQEPEGALETAGGIATARPWMDADGAADRHPFLAINADIWTDWPRTRALDIGAMLQQSGGRLRCHLVLADNPSHHSQGDFCLTEKADGLAMVMPKTIGPSLTFSGIGVYDPSMFDGLAAGVRAPLAPLLHQAIADGQCSGEHHRGTWSDVGTPERLQSLNL